VSIKTTDKTITKRIYERRRAKGEKSPFWGQVKEKERKRALSRDYRYVTITEEPSLGTIVTFILEKEPFQGLYSLFKEKGESPLQGLSMDTRNSESMKDSEKGNSTRKANENGMTIEHGFMSDHGYNTCVQTVYRDAFMCSMNSLRRCTIALGNHAVDMGFD
jgi:hypothetical protein